MPNLDNHLKITRRLYNNFGLKSALFHQIHTVYYYCLYPLRPVMYIFYLWVLKDKSFIFHQHKYRYFIHPYNFTWENERMVEIPIVMEIANRCRKMGGEILEIGNVLPHYYSVDHDIVDKHERGHRVINSDWLVFETPKRYDLIVSISTLEHIGIDDGFPSLEKSRNAIEKINYFLKVGGRAVITIPLSQNPAFDYLIAKAELKLYGCRFLKKSGLANWQEITFPFDNRSADRILAVLEIRA